MDLSLDVNGIYCLYSEVSSVYFHLCSALVTWRKTILNQSQDYEPQRETSYSNVRFIATLGFGLAHKGRPNDALDNHGHICGMDVLETRDSIDILPSQNMGHSGFFFHNSKANNCAHSKPHKP